MTCLFVEKFPAMTEIFLRSAGWTSERFAFTSPRYLHPVWYPPEEQFYGAGNGMTLSEAWMEFRRRQKLEDENLGEPR